jgi:predicted DNA-binding protein
MKPGKKVYGFVFREEDDRRLDLLAQATGWNRSQVVRELLKGATIISEAKVKVELERASFGVQGD